MKKRKLLKRVRPKSHPYKTKRFMQDLRNLGDETLWFIAICTHPNPVSQAAMNLLVNKGISRNCEYVGVTKARKEWFNA